MPTKAGFVFEGWYDNAELSGNVVRAPYSSDSKRVLYAKWSSDTVAIDRRSQVDDAKIATCGYGYTLWNGNYSYYSFTPTESKSYKIYTSDSCSTFIYLLDEYGHVIKYVEENGSWKSYEIIPILRCKKLPITIDRKARIFLRLLSGYPMLP